MRILVTGYGPFGAFTVNPSAIVVDQLAQQCRDGTLGTDDADAIGIELVTRVVDVDYAGALGCANWARDELNVDFAIHIGVYPGSGFVFLERRAFRDGYVSKDVKGAVPLQNCCELAERECRPPPSPLPTVSAPAGVQQQQNSPAGVPSSLSPCRYTVLDLDRLRTALMDAQRRDNGGAGTVPSTTTNASDNVLNIAISEDPGRYLCGYIYYCSLLNLAGRSLFVHIPPFDDKTHTPQRITRLLGQLVVEVAKQISTNNNMHTNDIGAKTGATTVDDAQIGAVAGGADPSSTPPPPPSLSSLMINNGLTVSFPLGGGNSTSLL
ncbi:hypothetical protein niasHS_014398 [Heterodera schachtii]|uniref:Pyroglutamyl-peptidase I n=1 Tax=Heterodera schachtii TaxID=97005 RepID=A0ABD2I759_HETSC